MTISTFLGSCRNDNVRLRISKRGVGRVYDGTIEEFKTGEEYKEAKSKLSSNEIFHLLFDVLMTKEEGYIRTEPLVIIII